MTVVEAKDEKHGGEEKGYFRGDPENADCGECKS